MGTKSAGGRFHVCRNFCAEKVFCFCFGIVNIPIVSWSMRPSKSSGSHGDLLDSFQRLVVIQHFFVVLVA